MPSLSEMKKSESSSLAERLVSNYVAPGTRLRLRKEACQQLKDREWIFNEVKDHMILLIDEKGTHGIAVGVDDIDWTPF